MRKKTMAEAIFRIISDYSARHLRQLGNKNLGSKEDSRISTTSLVD